MNFLCALLVPVVLIISLIPFVHSEYAHTTWIPIAEFDQAQQEEWHGVNWLGKPIFVVRINIGEGAVIGKLHPFQGTAHYYLHGQGEIVKKASEVDGDVLTYGKAHADWTEVRAGHIIPPPNLIAAGFDPYTKETLVVCRAQRYGHLEPGTFRFSESHQGCQAVDGSYNPLFELLSFSFYAIALEDSRR